MPRYTIARSSSRPPPFIAKTNAMGLCASPKSERAWQQILNMIVGILMLFVAAIRCVARPTILLVGAGSTTVLGPPTARPQEMLPAKGTRRRTAVDRSQWSVHRRRRLTAKRRLARLRPSVVALMTALDVLRQKSITPARSRQALAAWLSSAALRCLAFNERSRKINVIRMRRVTDAFWRHIREESDPTVLSHLLRMGVRLSTARDGLGLAPCARTDGRATVALLDIIYEHQDTLSGTALNLLMSLLIEVYEVCAGGRNWYPIDDDEGEATVRACLCLLARHITVMTAATAGRLATFLQWSMCSSNFELVDFIIDSPALSWIFDGVVLGADRDPLAHQRFCELLKRIIYDHAVRDETPLLLLRYYPRLIEALHCLSMIELAKCFSDDDISGILLTVISRTPSLMQRVYTAARHHCDSEHCGEDNFYAEKEYDSACQVAAALLGNALNTRNGDDLQKLLGMGLLLTTAKHFARCRAGRFILNEMSDVYRRILARFPCWKNAFRACTEQGPVGNTVADQGRTIPLRTTRSVEYIRVQEE